MARRRRRGGAYDRSRDIGRERALEHIHQAERLTRELGGSDNDVKAYFFSLDASQLSRILNEYERQHGRPAREYAEQTIPKWRDRHVHMSGMVAERLFGLLPRYMPLEQKYKLTESLWKHMGPVSHRTLYVNPSVPFDQVDAVVRGHLERDVLSYTIPEQMEKRFTWLAQGDIEVKQKLLNFFRAKERHLAAESLRLDMPILAEHLRSAQGTLTHHVAHKLQIGKNVIAVMLTQRVEGITETAPAAPSYGWVWWIVGLFILIAIFSK